MNIDRLAPVTKGRATAEQAPFAQEHKNEQGQRTNAKALVLCRTPFQAIMVGAIIKEENISAYDVVYFTQNDAEEDIFYFNLLSKQAEVAQYIFITPQRFDVTNYIKLYFNINALIKNARYAKIYISSIDNLVFRNLAERNRGAQFISFDDGTINLMMSSPYLRESGVKAFLRRLLFRVQSIKRFISRIDLHYSAYRDFDNIMPKEIIRFVDVFGDRLVSMKNCDRKKTFFIGQPLDEFYDKKCQQKLRRYLRGYKFDYYVKHPRETVPLLDAIPILDKKGRVAEEAIFEACSGSRPEIWGTFSTVLINIDFGIADKIMILETDSKDATEWGKIAEKAGCKVVFL
jgi:beta-galactosamide-alpha-2,3-sialyltransferase